MKKNNKKFKSKLKERQCLLSTGDNVWLDKPVDNSFKVRLAVGQFFEELFSFVLGYRRVKSSDMLIIPDMQNIKLNKTSLGEVKSTNLKSQIKINPEQMKGYRKLITDGEVESVKWVLIVHSFFDIAKQVEYESDVYKGLASNIIGACITDQDNIEEFVMKIKVADYSYNEWGKIQLIAGWTVKAMIDQNGRLNEVKEKFGLKSIDFTKLKMEEQEVFGCKVKPFPIYDFVCKSKVCNNPF